MVTTGEYPHDSRTPHGYCLYYSHLDYISMFYIAMSYHTVDGCEILHHQPDGFQPQQSNGIFIPPLKQLVQDFAPFHRISTGWWFGTFFLFFHNIWDNPSQLTNIFQRGRNHQPEMICVPRETRIISRRDVALKTSSRFAAGGDFARFFPEEVVSSSVKHGFLGKH